MTARRWLENGPAGLYDPGADLAHSLTTRTDMLKRLVVILVVGLLLGIGGTAQAQAGDKCSVFLNKE